MTSEDVVRTNMSVLSLTLVLAFGFVIIGCNSDDNPAASISHAPVIESVVANPDTITINDFFNTILFCSATDPDNDTLTYTWSSQYGTFESINNTDSIKWYSPIESGNYTITVTVSDSHETVDASINIFVEPFIAWRSDSEDPADNAEEVSITTDLSWSYDSLQRLAYDVYFGTTSNLGEDELVSSGLSSDTLDLEILENSTTYYWKVVAKASYGYESRSPVWSFTTIEN